MDRVRSWQVVISAGVVCALSATAQRAVAEDAKQNGDSAKVPPMPTGGFDQRVPIAVPGFFALEPQLALNYKSSAASRLLGPGWTIAGLSAIQRASPGRGAPGYAPSDIFLLDGIELIPCGALGGTHCTKWQRYVRVERDAPAPGQWRVTSKRGTRSVYVPLIATSEGTYLWGLSKVTDTHGNEVSYSYDCLGTPTTMCYPATIAYGGVAIRFYREPRADVVTFATGIGVGEIQERIKSIVIAVGGATHSAYKLSYAVSRNSSRSILAGVQRFGTDVALDASGTVTGGTSLPPTTLSYSDSPGGFAAGALWSQAHAGEAYDGDQVHYADVDGDGDEDLLFRDDDKQVWVSPSTGSRFSPPVKWLTHAGVFKRDQVHYPDVNGDGKADIVVRRDDNAVGVFLSLGTTVATPSSWLSMPDATYVPGARALRRRQRGRPRRPRLPARHELELDRLPVHRLLLLRPGPRYGLHRLRAMQLPGGLCARKQLVRADVRAVMRLSELRHQQAPDRHDLHQDDHDAHADDHGWPVERGGLRSLGAVGARDEPRRIGRSGQVRRRQRRRQRRPRLPRRKQRRQGRALERERLFGARDLGDLWRHLPRGPAAAGRRQRGRQVGRGLSRCLQRCL